MEDSGFYAGDWCNQNALDYFGTRKDLIKDVPMFSAGFLGLDMTNNTSKMFFNGWKNAMLQGAFKGSWADHRHDMTCASIIAKCHFDMDYVPLFTYLAYIGSGHQTPKETAVFHLKPTI